MGWLALVLLGLGAGGALWWLGAPRMLATLMAAALVLGATGYALQGKPMQPAAPVATGDQGLRVDPGLIDFRAAILGERHRGAMSLADGAMARGDKGEAVRILIDVVRRAPEDPGAWTALGTMLTVHDGQQLSPAARFAFAQAVRLDPKAPGPPFFLGISLLNAGEIDPARTAWAQALALTPANAPYRGDIVERLAVVDRFRAMMQGAPTQPPAPR
ncbi:cytochrome C biosynthesis protein [Sphingomonas sp. S1-29]|uniref:tetratricopeptide repeat protein n=1 Tax=Sphingomonas sp. S1-29 TaxID=2991074 RepID=UPI0022404B48|nr:cytochrome C biosynthesis protein [Sphingomonas sp. S1-29]UZK69526.1 cytochrome C biosynthesis protein [Sphingomonas sp. S1-29]